MKLKEIIDNSVIMFPREIDVDEAKLLMQSVSTQVGNYLSFKISNLGGFHPDEKVSSSIFIEGNINYNIGSATYASKYKLEGEKLNGIFGSLEFQVVRNGEIVSKDYVKAEDKEFLLKEIDNWNAVRKAIDQYFSQ